METHQTTNLGIAGSIPAKLVFFLFFFLPFFLLPHPFFLSSASLEKKSAPSRARTYDPGVISTMLYRLSYESSCEDSLDSLLFPVHSFSFPFLFDFSLSDKK